MSTAEFARFLSFTCLSLTSLVGGLTVLVVIAGPGGLVGLAVFLLTFVISAPLGKQIKVRLGAAGQICFREMCVLWGRSLVWWVGLRCCKIVRGGGGSWRVVEGRGRSCGVVWGAGWVWAVRSR